MVEDLVSHNTMDAATRKVVGDLLYHVPALIPLISIDADELAAVSKEWHMNSTIAIAMRPVIYSSPVTD
jgi:hypothetical protein